MPKGRKHAPSEEKDGIWFQHPSCRLNVDGDSLKTTTELMLNGVLDKRAHVMTTIRCPTKHIERERTNYIAENPFSLHDNRNTIQDKGEYFLQGLGRKKPSTEQNQHKSDDPTEWKIPGEGTEHRDISSIYREDFIGDMNTDAPTKRRYPKILQPPPVGPIELEPNATRWVDDYEEIAQTELQTLADSQEPYPSHNAWKYSYHRHSFALPVKRKQVK